MQNVQNEKNPNTLKDLDFFIWRVERGKKRHQTREAARAIMRRQRAHGDTRPGLN